MALNPLVGAMSGFLPGFNARPLLEEVTRVDSNQDLFTPSMLALPIDVLDSSAMVNVTLVTLKNLPFILTGRPLEVRDWKQIVETRLRYLEAGFMSVVSLVYNTALAVVFGALTLLTLGQLIKMRELCMKYTTHALLAGAAGVISAAGTVNPKYGVVANAAVWGGVVLIIYKATSPQFVQKVHQFYVSRRDNLKAAMLAGLNGNQDQYNIRFEPVFTYFDQELDHNFSANANLPALIRVFNVAYERYPFLLGTIVALGKEWILGREISVPMSFRYLA